MRSAFRAVLTGAATLIMLAPSAVVSSGPDGPALIRAAPTPSFYMTSATEYEGDSGFKLMTFTLSLANSFGGVLEGISQTYGVGDDPYPEPATATPGSDYSHHRKSWLLSDSRPSVDFQIKVYGDTVIEPDEFFYMQVFCTGSYICGFSRKGKILDDDAAALSAFSVDDVWVDEGNVGTRTADFEVTLAPAASSTISVEYGSCGVGCDSAATATPGEDYVPVGGTLSFPPGVTSKTVSVVINGDTDVEPDEVFFMLLWDPVPGNVGVDFGVGTIFDDDAITLSVPIAIDDTATVERGGTVVIDVGSNDQNPGGYALEVITTDDPTHGTATNNLDFTFTYVHDGSQTTSDSFGYKLSNGVNESAPATVQIDITGSTPPPIPNPTVPSMVTLNPARLLESRSGSNAKTVDHRFEGIGRRSAGSVTEVKVTGRGGIPGDADAVLMNVTAVAPDDHGYLTVFPCGSPRPLASNVNYGPGDVVPNAVLAKIGTGGKVCIYTLQDTDVLADVNGYVPAGGTPESVSPARLLETRSGPTNKTIDGLFEGDGRRGPGSVLELEVAGRGGVPADADAVLMNVTAVAPDDHGYLTVFPCGSPRPLASNVNYGPGDVVPNAVLAKIGTGGKVCIYTLQDTDVLADVNGYVPAGGTPESVSPARLLETRSGPTNKTIDGLFEGDGRRGPGSVLELEVAGRGGVPADADAVLMNVTAVAPDDHGYLTVFPCGSPRPLASNVNYGPGDVVPNAVLAKIGTGGKVCIYTLQDTDVLADVNGYVD